MGDDVKQGSVKERQDTRPEAPAETSDKNESAPARGVDLTGIFKQVSVQRATQDQPQIASGSDATQYFPTLGNDAQPLDSGSTKLTPSLQPTSSKPSRNLPSPEPEDDDSAQVGGGFTQLLRTLSREDIELFTPAASFPATSEGPGEFTQIVSRATLRDAMGRAVAPAQKPEDEPPPSSGFDIDPKAASSPSGTPLPRQKFPSRAQQEDAFASEQELASASRESPVSSQAPATQSRGKIPYLQILLIVNLVTVTLITLLVAYLLFRYRH